MARQNRIIRDETIRKRYHQFNQQKKYRQEFILEELSKEYFLSPRTIEDIVFKRA
jgi:hypothetical protein